MTVLETYASNLLKKEGDRPPNWKKIDFSNTKFKQKVGFLIGFEDILKKLGYDEEIYDEKRVLVGQKFPDSVRNPNPKMVEKVLTDLCIANYEIGKISAKTHPNWKILLEMKQIPPEYEMIDGSDSDSDNFDDEEETFVLASSPKTYHNQIRNNIYSIFEDDGMESPDLLPGSMERTPFTQLRVQEPGLTTAGPDMYAKQPAQGIFHKEHNSSSDFMQPAQEIPYYNKLDRTPPSGPPAAQHLQQVQNFKGPDQFSPFGQPNQSQNFSGSKPLPPFAQSSQNPTFTGPDHVSQFSPPNQGLSSNGPDRSSPFRQPKQRIFYSSSYQSSSFSQPEQRPGMVQAPPFRKQDQDLSYIQQQPVQQQRQPESSNQNFYSSDTTWVYSTSVITPIKSGPYQQPIPNSHEIEGARTWLPQIYSNEDEASSQGTIMKNKISEGLRTEIQSPPIRTNRMNAFNGRYDTTHSSYAPSQQLPHSYQSSHNFNYHEVSAPGGQYPRHSFNAGPGGYADNESPHIYDKLDRSRQGYPESSSFRSVPYEVPMMYQRNNSNDGLIGLNQPRYDPQSFKSSQMSVPSPPQGACLNLLGCIEMYVNT